MAYITHKDIRFDWEQYFKKRFEYAELAPASPGIDKDIVKDCDPYPYLVKTCFGCGEPLTVPYVYCCGPYEIAFHVPCAANFANALKRDVWEHQIGRRNAEILYQEIKPNANRLKRIKESPEE
jgi:hypothetical protein